jgi:hypothetical protein
MHTISALERYVRKAHSFRALILRFAKSITIQSYNYCFQSSEFLICVFVICIRYLRESDVILYDGAFQTSYYGYFYANSRSIKTMDQAAPAGTKANNLRIKRSRIIVEHFFSRVKGQWPILVDYVCKREHMGPIFTAAVIMTNIKSTFVCPMRANKCASTSNCSYCAGVRDRNTIVIE